MKRTALFCSALVLGAWVAGTGVASATMDMQKKAKQAGFAESTSCHYCHNEKLPKKGAVTSNDRGKWLTEQKEKKGAKEIDFTWLRDFTPPKK